MSPDFAVRDVTVLHARWCPINRPLTVQCTGPPKLACPSVVGRLPPCDSGYLCQSREEEGKQCYRSLITPHRTLSLFVGYNFITFSVVFLCFLLNLLSCCCLSCLPSSFFWQVTNMTPILATGCSTAGRITMYSYSVFFSESSMAHTKSRELLLKHTLLFLLQRFVAERFIGFDPQSDHPSEWEREAFYTFEHAESANIYLRSAVRTLHE